MVATQIFDMFIPNPGEMIHFDENIFQMGGKYQLEGERVFCVLGAGLNTRVLGCVVTLERGIDQKDETPHNSHNHDLCFACSIRIYRRPLGIWVTNPHTRVKNGDHISCRFVWRVFLCRFSGGFGAPLFHNQRLQATSF